jgi:hypothetical protein
MSIAALWVVQVFSQGSSLPCHRRPGCLVSRLRVNSGIRKVMVMRVFVAGGTGVMGRPPGATQEGATK